MSSSVNYKDLYEEFLSLTSSPKTSNDEDCQSDSHQLTPIKAKQPDTPVNSPLRALTPPSPISTSTTYSFPATTFLPLMLETDTEHHVGMSSNDFKMCDSSEVSTSPNSTVTTSDSEKQSPTDSTSQSNGQSNYFQNLPPPSVVSSTGAGIQGGLQHSLSALQNQSNMIMEAHQHHHIPIHHQANHYTNQHLQHQLMEGHPQHQMLSMAQQQGNVHHHQFSHLPPSHVPHPSVHSNSQTLMPFGMNFNSVGGNGAQYINNQMGAFFHNNHHSQQQTHPQTMQQQATCFMQHSCMHMQNPLIAALNTPRSSSSTVGWMGGAQASSVPVSNSVTNTCSASALSSALASMTSAKMTVPNNILHPTIEDSTTLPGGLEHLWKKMPTECQRLMTPQDIPDSARHRGYFTVCELLQLKRALISRLECGAPSAPIRTPAVKNSMLAKKYKEEGKRGSKKGMTNSNNNSQVSANSEFLEGYGSGQRFVNQPQQEKKTRQPTEQKREENGSGNTEQDLEDSTFREQMIALANLKNEEIVIRPDMPPITGICVAGAVKDAMNALTSDENNASAERDEEETENDNDVELNRQDEEKSDYTMNNSESFRSNELSQNAASHSEAGITGEELAMLPPLPPISEILPKKQTLTENLINSTNGSLDADTADDDHKDMTEEERQRQIQLALVPITSMTTSPPHTGTSTGNINSSATPVICRGSLENRPSAAAPPPPPFRTSTLVLKLLQIGCYCIRSFSSINPNRLRVMFNTNRITYECQLPIIQPTTPNQHLMRKVLTIDIGFEQISMLRFGTDNFFMRVEGAPLLTLSYCPALEESNIQVLTHADEVLLDQIEQGQLKLSPCHQLYFLNERLVQQLESQFREHPRFRHLLFEDAYGNQTQKRMRMS